MTHFFPSSRYLEEYFMRHKEYSGYYKKQWFRIHLSPSGLWMADVHASQAGRGVLSDARLDALLLKVYQRLEEGVYAKA